MLIQGQAGALSSTGITSGNPTNPAGARAELIVSELRGKYANAVLNGFVFTAGVAAVTVPAIANNLVSTFSLLNPQSSSKLLELISFDAGVVLATTVVDLLGLYFQANIGRGTTVPSSQTTITPQNCLLGSAATGQGTALSAATHVGTPTILTYLMGWGAVTETSGGIPDTINFDGKYILPAGSVVSAAMSTAASTASGVSETVTWAEW